ncbi:hypothetical protein F5879DRAFT_978708 [Lentinula edodes]|nr:hypothetical protein F5879DRAFT_978708 [Lentinula edodes]
MGAGTTYHNFFDPSYMTTSSTPQANITFVFVGIGNYSITQSSFESPCTPLDGGFDSGLVHTENSSTAARATLTLGTVGETVWFFSQQSDPDWRCNSSIVGALNPPVTGNLTFASFLANANATGPTTSRSATAATLDPSTVVPRTSSLSETHSAIATAPTASTSYPPAITGHSVTAGAIVGGVLGGAIVVVVALLAVLFSLREREARRRTSVRRRSILAQDLEGNLKFDSLAGHTDDGTRRKSIPQLDHPELLTQMNLLDYDPCTNVAHFPAVSIVLQRPKLSFTEFIAPASRNLSGSESNVEDPTEASRQRDTAIENSPLIINRNFGEIRAQRLIEHVCIEAERAIAEIRRAQTNANAVILNASSGENAIDDGNAHVLFSETPPPPYQLSDTLKRNV